MKNQKKPLFLTILSNYSFKITKVIYYKEKRDII